MVCHCVITLIEKKILKAQELLRRYTSVTRVAMELSFSSSQYFAVVFRRYVGISPTAWCKQVYHGKSSTKNL